MKHDRFDPELKMLMDELEPIFKKYGAMAFVNATSRTHGEFRIFFPDWSVAQFEKQENGQMAIRFKSKKGEQTHEDTEATVYGIMSIRDMSARAFANMEELKSLLDKHMEIDHKPMPVIPHGED